MAVLSNSSEEERIATIDLIDDHEIRLHETADISLRNGFPEEMILLWITSRILEKSTRNPKDLSQDISSNEKQIYSLRNSYTFSF